MDYPWASILLGMSMTVVAKWWLPFLLERPKIFGTKPPLSYSLCDECWCCNSLSLYGIK